MAGVWVFVAFMTLVGLVLGRVKPSKFATDLLERAKGWWWVIGCFQVALLAEGAGMLVLFGGLSVAALREYRRLMGEEGAHEWVWRVGYGLLVGQYALVWAQSEWFLSFVPLVGLIALAAVVMWTESGENFLRPVGTVYVGVMMLGYCLSHAAYLGEQKSGPAMVLFVVLLTEMNDVAQYLSGKTFGGPKIAPRISPKKTWAGFGGGMAMTASLGAIVGPLLTPLPVGKATLLGMVIAGMGLFGDLCQSAVKRECGAKDSGAVLAGQGGVWDRVDSLVMTAPVAFHWLM